jgi:WD40 repeat protein
LTLLEKGINKLQTTYSDVWHELSPYSIINSAAFAKDGRSLLTCSRQGIALWDLESGQERWRLIRKEFMRAEFSPTDPTVALASSHPQYSQLGIVDVGNAKFRAILNDGRADVLCFAPNGREFARWDRETRIIRLQNLDSGTSEDLLNTAGAYIEQMAFSPNGRTLATCNLNNGQVDLVDVPSRKSAGQLQGHTGRGFALAISPDGRWLASGGADQTIRIWNFATLKEERQLHGHRGGVKALGFSPDSQTLVSGGHDGTIRFWDVVAPPPIANLTNVPGTFAISPEGHWLVAQDSNCVVRLWELPERRLIREWSFPPVCDWAFSPSGFLLAACIGETNSRPFIQAIPRSSTQTFEIASPATVFLCGVTSACTAMAFSPNCHFIATGYNDGTIALWETATGKLVSSATNALNFSVGFSVRKSTAALNPIVFSLDGRTLAAASFDGVQVRTWTALEMKTIGGRQFGAVYPLPMAVSPDGRQVALGGLWQGLSVNLWDTDLIQSQAKLQGHQDYLSVVAYSPDGRTLATGGRDGLLKLWNLPTRRELGTILELPRETQFVHLAFCANGSWLAANDTSGRLYLFQAARLGK